MTFSDMQAQARSLLIEATARFFTDVEVKRFINLGYKNFLSRTGWAERCSAQPAVANQYEYALPADTIKIRDVRWADIKRLAPKSREEFSAIVGRDITSTTTEPDYYTAYPWDRRIRIYPIPSTASDATAINDGAGITSSATTITVDSTADFPSNGIILIESEQILYYAKTATTFAQCVRGHGRTTAATHADDVAVKFGDIQIYNTYVPAELSGSSDEPEINEEYHEALVLYAVQLGLMKREKYAEANKIMERYLEMVERAEGARRRETLDAHTHIMDVDVMDEGY